MKSTTRCWRWSTRSENQLISSFHPGSITTATRGRQNGLNLILFTLFLPPSQSERPVSSWRPLTFPRELMRLAGRDTNIRYTTVLNMTVSVETKRLLPGRRGKQGDYNFKSKTKFLQKHPSVIQNLRVDLKGSLFTRTWNWFQPPPVSSHLAARLLIQFESNNM